jgi:hypothetical protein
MKVQLAAGRRDSLGLSKHGLTSAEHVLFSSILPPFIDGAVWTVAPAGNVHNHVVAADAVYYYTLI